MAGQTKPNNEQAYYDLQQFMIQRVIDVGKDMQWRCQAAGMPDKEYWAMCISALLRVSAALIGGNVQPFAYAALLKVFEEMIHNDRAKRD